ncbi:MAG: hypothetical protein QOJ89_326 [bacterium]
MEAGALRAPAGLNRVTVASPLLRLRTDEQLVALFRAGNDAAFGVIHDRYRQRLFAYARQMLGGSRQDAEDALQDVFLRAYSSLRSNDRPLSLRAWLYRVAHNRCIDHLRRPIPAATDLFDTSRKPLHDPIAECERREDLRRLVADVQRLPEQQRSALLMREIDGLSYAELADALGVTLPAVKSLLVRARIGLVEAIEARDTACSDIRLDLVHADDRGVRASGLSRRHLRDCESCVEYRTELRSVGRRLGALTPDPGIVAGAMKLLGLGGAGSAGAASAGGGAAASGGLLAAGSGTVAKVAAVVCCAAITAGGAAEVRSVMETPSHDRPAQRTRSAGTATTTDLARSLTVGAQRASASAGANGGATVRQRAKHSIAWQSPGGAGPGASSSGSATLPAAQTEPSDVDPTTGGAVAPDEDTGFGYGVDGLDPAAPALETDKTPEQTGADAPASPPVAAAESVAASGSGTSPAP